MYSVSRQDLAFLHTRPKEEIDLFLALEKAAIVSDSVGNRFVAIRQMPHKDRSIYLFAHVETNIPATLLPDPHSICLTLPSSNFLFWRDADNNILGPVKTLSLQEFLGVYTLEEEIKELPFRNKQITTYKHVESLPIGMQQNLINISSRESEAIDQYIDVVQHEDQVVLYLHHNYNGKFMVLDLTQDSSIYEDFRNAVTVHLPQLKLAYSMAGKRGRLTHTSPDSRIKVAMSPKSIPVQKGHVAFRFSCEHSKNSTHVSLSWK